MRNKILIVFTLVFCLLGVSESYAQSSSQSDYDFYSVLLDGYSTHGKFIAVDIKSDEYNGKAIIENGNLYYFLGETKGFNQNQYKVFVKDLLLKESKLSLGKSDLNKWHFIKINKIEAVENYANKGKNELIAHYFDRVDNKYFDVFVIKKEIDDDETNAVIAKLFDWKIVSQVDDETGYLVISLMK